MAGTVGVLGLLGSKALVQGQVLHLVPAVLASAFTVSVIYAATAPIAVHPALRDRR